LLDVAIGLDETCSRILRVLLEEKILKFNSVKNAVTKLFDYKITNKELTKHLRHLVEKELVKRDKAGSRNVIYCLSDKFRALTQLPIEDIKKYIALGEDPNLPLILRTSKLTKQDLYGGFSGDELDEETDKDLHDVLSLNLWELRLSVDYDLSLREEESDEAFWAFLGKPTYRIHEEEIAEKCRYNEKYKQVLFEKINLLIDQLRSDRELFRGVHNFKSS